MISLKNDPKEQDSEAAMYPEMEQPAYPWGLELCLCDEVLQKIGMTGLPAVGAKVRIVAVATVTSVSQYEEMKPDAEDGGTKNERSVRIQITDMDPLKAATSMYDNSSMNP